MENQPVLYKPYEQRNSNTCYRDLVQTVVEKGKWKKVIHGEPALTYSGFELRYNMEDGFPVITERKITKKMFNGSIAEHIGFLHGASTLKDLMSYDMPPIFWEKWVTKEKCEVFGLEEGDLGPGSYGAAWARFPTPDGGSFDQISSQINLMKERPHLRTFMISPWIPFWTNWPDRKVVVAPCHGWIQMTLFPEDKTFTVLHYQRSGDILVGVPLNLIHYGTFGLMLGHELGYKFTEYVHYIADAHIYERQMKHAENLLAFRDEEKERLPTVTISEEGLKKDFFSLRTKDFILSDYAPQVDEYIPIDTPI